MTEEKSLFKKEKRADFYRKIIFLGKRIHVIFLYFCIIMNLLVVGMIVIGDPSVGIFFFALNTWFLLVLMLKLRSERRSA